MSNTNLAMDQFCPKILYPSMFLTAMIIIIGILSIILILTIGIKNIVKKSPEIHFMFKVTFWISLILIFFWLLLWPIAIFLCHIDWYQNVEFTSFLFQISCIFFGIMIRTCYITTWYLRLYIVFKDSVFDVTPNTKRLLFSFAIFIIIIKLISFVLFIISYHQYAKIISVFGEFIYSIFVILIVATFLIKLNKLILNAANKIHKTRDIDNVRLPPYQLDMIRGASRYLILSTFGLIFTLISIIINILLILFMNNISLSRAFQIYFAFILLDHYINFICLYCQYSFGRDIFEYLCSFCDIKMRKYLNHWASQKTKKESINLPQSNPVISQTFRVSVIMDKMQQKEVNHVNLEDLVDEMADILVDPSERVKLMKKLPSHSNTPICADNDNDNDNINLNLHLDINLERIKEEQNNFGDL